MTRHHYRRFGGRTRKKPEDVAVDMDLVRVLPVEIVEDIFALLSVKDLVTCSTVSVRWREAANNNKHWSRICLNLSWTDPFKYAGVQSNFINLNRQLYIPNNSERLVPICEWKLYYCQQKFLKYNRRRGRYVAHWFAKNVKGPKSLTFVSTEPTERLYFPIVTYNELSMVRLDGKPKTVCLLETTRKPIDIIACHGHLIAYIHDNKLKLAFFDNDFSTKHTKSFKIVPDDCILTRSNLELMKSREKQNFFIDMNEDYIVAGDKLCYMYVWCRKSYQIINFIQCPIDGNYFTYINLYKHDITFSTESKQAANNHQLFEYSLINEKSTFVDFFSNSVRRVLSNDKYLVVIATTVQHDINSVKILERNLDKDPPDRYKCIWQGTQDLQENWGVNLEQPEAFILNDLLFYLQGYSIKIVGLNDPMHLRSEFNLTCSVHRMFSIGDTILLLVTTESIELWDWEKGIKLYTPCVNIDCSTVYFDDTRIIAVDKDNREAKVIGFY